MEKSLKKYFFLFVFPTLAAFLVAFLVPFFMGLYLSFTKFTTVSNVKFTGLANYIEAFSNKDFLNAFVFTSAFTVVSVITINVIAFFLALGIKGQNLFRTVLFMPNLIGGIVLGYIWQLILNGALLSFGYTITTKPVFGFWGLVILMNWQMAGYMMVIYIAGIQNIPSQTLEAAKIDGATPWQTLKSVILPMVMPSVTICLFLTLSN